MSLPKHLLNAKICNKETCEYVKELEKENKKLKSELECYENGLYFSSEIDNLQERINTALNLVESYEMGKYDYSIPPIGIIELKDILKGKL